jgi:hypothetical protein
MRTFVLMFVIAIFSLPVACAVEGATDATENFDISDEELFLDLGLAISGIKTGRSGPQAAGNCQGTAVCRQKSSCNYKCFGEAGGDYIFNNCSGQVGLTLCKFQGGPTNCTVRCIPNPF